ncbi:hypothetical protein ACMBCM_10360 [Spiroplasma sp. K1]
MYIIKKIIIIFNIYIYIYIYKTFLTQSNNYPNNLLKLNNYETLNTQLP